MAIHFSLNMLQFLSMYYANNTLVFTIAHSCVFQLVHTCFFVPTCPLRVFNPCFFARAMLSTPAISDFSVAPYPIPAVYQRIFNQLIKILQWLIDIFPDHSEYRLNQERFFTKNQGPKITVFISSCLEDHFTKLSDHGFELAVTACNRQYASSLLSLSFKVL